MRGIIGTLAIAAALSVTLLSAGPADAQPCLPEGPCAPCPIVVTFEGGKPHIGYAQC